MKKTLLFLIALISLQLVSAQDFAIQLDGQSEYLSVPHKDNQNIGDNFTVEAWIYANSWTNEIWRGSIINKDNQGPDRGYAFRVGDNGKLSFVIAVDNTWQETFTSSIMNTKQWHHIAGTVDNGTVKLYIDGQEVANGSFSGTPSALPMPLRIGASNFDGRFFDGIIDEVRLWSTTRTAQQIAEASTQDLIGNESGLELYLPMKEGSGNTTENLVDANCSATGVGIDDSNWVEGYSLPDFDISTKGIQGFDRINMKTRPIKLMVDLQNTGTNEISDYTLEAYVNGDLALSENFDVSIPAGELTTVTFKTPLDLVDLDRPNIEIVANHPDDGNLLNNRLSTTINNEKGPRVQLWESEQHNFGAAGQNQFQKVVLPKDLSPYSQILLHISVDCPSTGCDPWDQTANIVAITPNGNFEIARYITPFGIACGPWTVDITDFRSILEGSVEYNSFVQVFGSSGWLVNVEMEFIEGNASLPFSKVTPLWRNDYQVYGDPGISYDFDPFVVTRSDNTASTHLRMQVTGHGQGNTNNAAEFFDVRHSITVDGTEVDQHHLWKDDCPANTCADQLGTWLFPRAGWCPGQEVRPYNVDLTSILTAQQNASIDYVLQDYTNLLNTGYNSSGHTEPHYRVHGFLIEESSDRYVDYRNLRLENLRVESSNQMTDLATVDLFNDGSVPVEGFTVNLFDVDGRQIFTRDYTLTMDPGEGIELLMQYNSAALSSKYIAEVIYDNTENPGDNLVRSNISVSAEEAWFNNLITVAPNPSQGIVVVSTDNLLLGAQLTVIDAQGKLISNTVITEKNTEINFEHQGLYYLKVTAPEGQQTTRKVVIVK